MGKHILNKVRKTAKGLLPLCLYASMPLAVCAQQMTDTESHSPYIQAVDEYVPAPGQFINTMPPYEDGDTPATMAAKCTAYLADNNKSMVCLGAYGGYITFHFDHSIANLPGRRDIYIQGNSYQARGTTLPGGSSEPGIVMVSKDINHDGLPNDPWYELAGSADVDSAGLVVYNYELTYTKQAMQNIPWTDNQGNSGTVDRNGYHEQEYFPLWLGDELTFQGTLLPPNGFNLSTGDTPYWVLMFLREGYVDNKPNTDVEANSFDISWAVDCQRQPVALDFVDFVRVYTAVNQKCGWLGESSTEILGAEDLHLEASVEAIRTAGISSHTVKPAVVSIHTADGISRQHPVRGLNILYMSDGSIRKTVRK